LKVQKKQERTLCSGSITIGNKAIRIFCTHLDMAYESVRLKQLDQILPHIDQNIPHLILGDFNALCQSDYSDEDWENLKAVRAKNRWEAPKTDLYKKLMDLGYTDSFPGRDHTSKVATVWAHTRIDWILWSSKLPANVNSYNVLDTDASDHLPVVVKLQIT